MEYYSATACADLLAANMRQVRERVAFERGEAHPAVIEARAYMARHKLTNGHNPTWPDYSRVNPTWPVNG